MPLCHKQSRRSRDAPMWSWHQPCVGHSKNYLYYIVLREGEDDGSDGDEQPAADLAGGAVFAEKESCGEDDLTRGEVKA